MKSEVILHSFMAAPSQEQATPSTPQIRASHSYTLGAGRSQKSGEDGFTLIEIIITLVVLSLAVVGVLSVFSLGIGRSADPLIVGQATQLAQEKMDTIIGDRMNTARGFNYIIPGNYPAENPVTGFAAFNRSVTIICVNAGTLNTNNLGAPPCASGYTHVTVTVTNVVIGNVTVDGLVTNY